MRKKKNKSSHPLRNDHALQEAVLDCYADGVPLIQIADRTGIAPKTLRQFIAMLEQESDKAFAAWCENR